MPYVPCSLVYFFRVVELTFKSLMASLLFAILSVGKSSYTFHFAGYKNANMTTGQKYTQRAGFTNVNYNAMEQILMGERM